MSIRGLVGVPVAATPVRDVSVLGAFTETAGISVTTPGTAHTKSAWSQVIASTTTETGWVVVWGSSTAATQGMMMDVGVGGAGAEIAVAENLLIGAASRASGGNSAGLAHMHHLPLRIPKGSRVALRVQGTVTSVLNRTTLYLFTPHDGDRLRHVSSGLAALGADTATSRGVAVTADNTWTQVVASTSVAYAGVIPTFQINDSTTGNTQRRLDVGIGASGAEVAIGSTWFHSTTAGLSLGSILTPMWRHIPAGSRLSVRCDAAATDNLDAALIGIPYA